MKKFILFVLLAAMSFTYSYAQVYNKVNFICKENAEFVNEIDEKDFVVFEYPGFSADSLYNKIMDYLKNSDYNRYENLYGIKSVIDCDPGKEIVFHVALIDAYYEKVMGFPFRKHLLGTFSFKFKDERLRVDAPVMRFVILGNPDMRDAANKGSESSFSSEISSFYKNGQIKKKKARLYNSINTAVNTALNEILAKAFETKVSEDW